MSSDMAKKVLSTVGRLLSSILLITYLVAVSQTSYYVSAQEANEVTYDGVRHIIVTLVISGLFLYMYVRAQMIHNTYLRKKCSAPLSGNERVKFIFSSLEYRFDCIVFFFLLFAFDLNNTFSVLAELLGGGSDAPTKLKVMCVSLPVIMTLDFLARYMAIGCWFQPKDESSSYMRTPSLGNDPMAKNSAKLVPTAPEFLAMRFLSRTYSVNSSSNPILEHSQNLKIDESRFTSKAKFKSFLLVFLPIVLMIALSKFLYSTVKMFVWILIELAVMWQTWVIIAALLGAIFVARIIRAWFNRYKFLRLLKNVCKNNKYKLSRINAPYKSLFSLQKGENFSVTANGKIYSCKFISCSRSAVPLLIDKEGTATFVHGITFAGVNWFQSTRKFEYAYETNSNQVLIINPSMKFTYVINDGLISELDNGDCIGEYLVYTGNSFINAIDRNCVDKKEV